MATNPCILRINRSGDGVLTPKPGLAYTCGSGRTAQATETRKATFNWRITGAPGCDQSKPVLPSGLLTATGTLIVRKDGFAHFAGRFTITVGPDVHYSGKLELVFESGSHQALGEHCDEKNHVEGWLRSDRKEAKAKHTISAALVANWRSSAASNPFPKGAATMADASVNRITGTLLQQA